MGVDVRIALQDQGVASAVERLRLGLPLGGSMRPAMEGMGRVLKTRSQLSFKTQTGPDGEKWKPSHRAKNEGGQTLSLSRRLRNSITYQADAAQVAVGTNVLYAAIHHLGGTIRAKNGPFLAIPITHAARKAGSPRNMELHVVQTLKGQFILVDKAGMTHFLLRDRVTIPARPFLGMADADRPVLVGVVERYLAQRWGQ